MQCRVIDKFINEEISKNEFENHKQGCSYCYEMDSKLNEAFSILDENVEVPRDLAGKVIRRKNEQNHPFSIKRDFSMILQIACVAIAGIFLGIMLGRNSNTQLLTSKNSERTKSLIEYKNSHHFNVSTNLFK